MNYETRLKKAPLNHFSKEFLEYISMDDTGRSVVIYEDVNWLVIKNYKYHTDRAPWYTAFYKPPPREPWHNHLQPLIEIFGDWEWRKKSHSEQTVRRFHLHLIRK